MATNLNPPFKYRPNSFYSEPFQFQRGEGKIKIKKVQRKITIKFKHIFLFFLLFGGIFYSFQKLYLFLLSWDNLMIKEIQVLCQKEAVKQEIQKLVEAQKLGNILLVDITHLKARIETHKWVKQACIRKVFPSTLKIEVKEREPQALLKKQDYYLVDEEGVLLEKVDSREKVNLPLLVDSNNFEQNYKEKLKLAWECLKNFSTFEKEQAEVLDLTDDGTIVLQFKEKPTRIILGNSEFSQKLALFQKHRAKWENQFGPLDYVDLRFEDRLYIKPQEIGTTDVIPNLKKEVE